MSSLLHAPAHALETNARTAARAIDQLISGPNALRRVQRMDPREVHALIQRAGLDQAIELIELASAPQVQALIDFECWNRDRLDTHKLANWLETLLSAPDDSVNRWLLGLDLEPLVAWIREHATVLLWEDDRDALDMIDAPVLSSPDGVYALVMGEDERASDIMRTLLDRAYSFDLEFGRRLLEAARWELSADLEETGYRFRTARLEDLGYVGFDEALAVYAPRDPAAWLREATSLPLFAQQSALVSGPAPGDLETRWFELGPAPGRDSITARALNLLRQSTDAGDVTLCGALPVQYAALIQRVLVADGGTPGAIDHLRQAAELADARVELALDYATRGNETLAAEVLRRNPLRELHRVGVGIVSKLGRQAVALLRRGNLSITDEPSSLVTEAQADLLAGLAGARPLRTASSAAPFRTMSEVETASHQLADLAFLELWFFGRLRWTRAELTELVFNRTRCANPVEWVGFRMLLASTLVAEAASPGAGLRPVEAREVEALAARHRAGERATTLCDAIAAMLRERLPRESQLDAVTERVAADVATWLDGEILPTGSTTASMPELLRGFLLRPA